MLASHAMIVGNYEGLRYRESWWLNKSPRYIAKIDVAAF